MTVVKMVTVTQILEIAIVMINMKDLIVQVISNKKISDSEKMVNTSSTLAHSKWGHFEREEPIFKNS